MRKTTAGLIVVACASLVGYACVAPRPVPRPAPRPAPTQPAPPSAGTGDFLETFDTAAGFTNRFKTQALHGFEPVEIPTWLGDHDMSCGAPTTTRTVHAAVKAESFYWCGPGGPSTGHIMTSMNTSGFAQLSFSPNQAFTKIKRVCWDQNLTELGGRKWTQVAVIPETLYQANGQQLRYVNPAIEDGIGASGLRISGDAFIFQGLRGSAQTFVGQTIYDDDLIGFTTPDKAQRFRHCITDLENGRVRIEMQRPSGTDVRELLGGFPNGAARVIFQDESYDPEKDTITKPANPFTWHWDNVLIDV